MKKITLLMLLAVLVLPMNAKISTTIAKQQPKVANYLAKRNGVSPKACDQVTNLYAVTPNRDGSMVWDFEDATAGYAPFTVEDQDGDGYNWTYYNNTGLETGRMTAHEGEGLIASASYDNDTYTALTPNNWLISPEVTLGGSLKFWAMGQDASYCAEKFGVYVTVDGTNYTQVGADKTATGEYVEYEYDLTPYTGQTGKFAIVHHNVTDMFFLNVDDITFDPGTVVTPEPTIPTNVAVVPTATTGEVSWVPGENNGSWNLRWRPYVDPALAGTLWDLPLDGYSEQVADFSVIDNDGDGKGWGLAYSSEAQDDVCFYSASYDSQTYSALTPDNWLITPVIGLGGTLKFKAKNASTTYPDVFRVYVSNNDEISSVEDFVAISEDITPDAVWTEYEFDLGAFEGNGVIAFRHYNCTDQMAVYIDDIEIIPVDAVEIPDWTVVENVENPYTIEGLAPETEYEVEVMALNEAGDKYTDWTESTHFTTLAETVPEISELYVVGSFNGWNTTAEGGRIELVENEDGTQYTGQVDLEAGAEFKVITFNAEGNTVWFGGIDETQSGHFLINAGLLGVDINLIDGANFMVEDAGKYNITVMEPVDDRALQEPLVMIVTKEATAISTVGVDTKADNRIFDIMGRELKSVPENGIYIQNGKKYVK